MGMKLSALRTDKEKQTEGVWHEFAAGLRFKIASAAQPEFQAWMTKHARERRRVGDDGHADPVLRRGMAMFLLRDWDGLEDDDGKTMPYSVGDGYDALTGSEEIYQFVDVHSMTLANFRKEAEEEEVKNSPRVLTGSSSTATKKKASVSFNRAE